MILFLKDLLGKFLLFAGGMTVPLHGRFFNSFLRWAVFSKQYSPSWSTKVVGFFLRKPETTSHKLFWVDVLFNTSLIGQEL